MVAWDDEFFGEFFFTEGQGFLGWSSLVICPSRIEAHPPVRSHRSTPHGGRSRRTTAVMLLVVPVPSNGFYSLLPSCLNAFLDAPRPLLSATPVPYLTVPHRLAVCVRVVVQLNTRLPGVDMGSVFSGSVRRVHQRCLCLQSRE